MTTAGGVSADYDAIADWYADYVTGEAAKYTARAGEALERVLGPGRGFCWDLACGSGVYGSLVRRLGWTPVGSDISIGLLRHARDQGPVVQADAGRLPLRDGAVPAVISVLCHTDVPDYAQLCREAARVLAPGGRFAHLGVHPCFIGAFVDRSDDKRLVTLPGYYQRHPTGPGFGRGVRARVGASHSTLSQLLTAMTRAGLVIDYAEEEGDPVPDVLAIGAHRPRTL